MWVSISQNSKCEGEESYQDEVEKDELFQIVSDSLKHGHDGWVKSDDSHCFESSKDRLSDNEDHDSLGEEEKGARKQVKNRHDDGSNDVEAIKPVTVVHKVFHWSDFHHLYHGVTERIDNSH